MTLVITTNVTPMKKRNFFFKWNNLNCIFSLNVDNTANYIEEIL